MHMQHSGLVGLLGYFYGSTRTTAIHDLCGEITIRSVQYATQRPFIFQP